MTTTVDPVIGALHYDLCWRRADELSLFGVRRQLNTYVDSGATEFPTDSQRTAYQWFSNNKQLVAVQAEAAIDRHYLAIQDDYRARFGVFADQWMPLNPTADTHGRLLEDPFTLIFPRRSPKTTLILLMLTTWESSLGIGVEFVDGLVTRVDVQDEFL
jgi:hypothetical protein